jgi:hypothetical protein
VIDGEKKAGAVVKHSFPGLGRHTVELTVSDTVAGKKTVDLAKKSVIHVTIKTGTAVEIRRLAIRDAVAGSERFLWTFGAEPPVENAESTQSRKYDDAGTYRVRVEIDYVRKDAKAGDPPGKLIYTVYLHVVQVQTHSVERTLEITAALPSIHPPWEGVPGRGGAP